MPFRRIHYPPAGNRSLRLSNESGYTSKSTKTRFRGGSLWQHLRCQKKRRKRYGSGRDRRGQILGRRPIPERHRRVESRREIGNWVLDTIIGKGQKQAIVSIVERKSGYAVLAKVPRKTADRVSTAIITSLKPVAAMVETLTYDNGKEFCRARGHR
jgi:transposase, IS30 family